MTELNPNHPVTAAVHEHWHKLCALLLHKLTDGHAVLTASDVDQLVGSGAANIVIQETERGIELTLVSDEEGDRLARQHGGLPQ
ncbi:hypothetical protein AU476_07380 [Cupriavidus sp. UYMSc13B]|nr:hypothetical protein AU476_07380 [Cupriavidus sp. UYMSc13B]